MAVNSRSDNGERRGDWSWEDDDRAYEERLPELMVKYEGRYVAMFRGEVIGVASRPELLLVARIGEPLLEPMASDMWVDAPREVVTE